MALKRAVLGMSLLLTLTGCQLTQPLRNALSANAAQRITLSCRGVPSCAFERVNQWQGDALKTYVIKSAAESSRSQHLFKRLGFKNATSSTVQTQTLQLPAAQYEVVIQFYPISKDRAEVFHVIHRFQAQQNYHFKMYRKRDESAGSLLNVSTPDPLCVDLYQADQIIRRFCRPFDAVTGAGEYVEQKL